MFIARKQDERFQNLNFLTTYYSVEKGQPFHSVLQSSLNLLTDQLPKSVIERMGSHLGSFFKNGKFTLGAFGTTVGVDKSETPAEVEHYLKDQAVSILTNILKGLEEDKISGSPADGALIVIDEIHNVKDLGGVAQILRSISATLDINGHGNLSFLIIGYPEAITTFFSGDPSAKRNFDQFSLENMPDDEAAEILIKGFNEGGIIYEEQLIQKKIGGAGGYPHSIQVLGHNLVEVDSDNCINDEDWVKAISKAALELQGKDFSNLYDFQGKPRLREVSSDWKETNFPKFMIPRLYFLS